MTAVEEYRRIQKEPVGGDWSDARVYEEGFHFGCKYGNAAIAELEAENHRLREENKRAVYGCCEECRALAELETENHRLRLDAGYIEPE